MDVALSISCRNIEDDYVIDLHEDDGLSLYVSTFVKNLNVVHSYSLNTKKTLFVVEVHVNQKKFWQAKVDLPGHDADGEIVQLATLTTSFANDFSFEFDDLTTLEEPKPSKVTVILEIGVARCVYVPYDHRGEKIMQRNLQCSSSHDDDEFEMDKKFEKDGMDDDDCPVCHCMLLMEPNITRMPCGLLLHTKCLSKWLPLRRSPIWGPDGSIHGDVKE
ncbi:hypothetical protein FRX31_019035 [Thalictrum thalictroides]|uniref:RING-type domain-containing protein n=1 Tax=Thalictrum thalictroides TaxID=46969 RepID=A0A7J6W1Y2_THATH|nr:hypothetical protein FRX31_019035 [Thalictrum thalictroides]